jgi:hypothetical protein
MFEPVYAVFDYYDQPRVGVASCAGQPHLFESEWDEAEDDFLSSFKLWPVDDTTLDLVKDQWAMWLRWDQAFHSGRTDLSTHPALPEDRPRWDDLKVAAEERFQKAKAGPSMRKKGNFRGVDRQNYEVEWMECDV